MNTTVNKLKIAGLALGASLAVPGVQVEAQGEPFYDDKTIRVVVGLSTGFGYDRVARALAKHMTKHIPGNPEMIVQNMPGAGSVIAANFVYGVAKADGLTLLAPHNNEIVHAQRRALQIGPRTGQSQTAAALRFHWGRQLRFRDV